MVTDVPPHARWSLVVLMALAYPVAILVSSGVPPFPSRDDCIRPATKDGQIEAVFGYRDSELEGRALRDRVVAVGFVGAEIQRDACGRVRVFVRGIPTLDVGSELADEARSVGIDVALEQAD
jgi:hypothetical protein